MNEKNIVQAMAEINDSLNALKEKMRCEKAVFVGNNRVLTQSKLLDLIYLVQADDRLIMPRFVMDGIYEAEVTNFFIKNITKGSACMDVGANFGYYTCLMSRLATEGTVLGVEADPLTFELLRDNVAINWLNNCGRYLVLNVAVSDNDGELTLYRRGIRSGNTSVVNPHEAWLKTLGEPKAESFTVACKKLDSIHEHKLDFLKIDIEGVEALAFRGADRILSENPQLQIVMEWSPGQAKAAGQAPLAMIEHLKNYKLNPFTLNNDGSSNIIQWSDVAVMEYGNLLLKRAGNS